LHGGQTPRGALNRSARPTLFRRAAFRGGQGANRGKRVDLYEGTPGTVSDSFDTADPAVHLCQLSAIGVRWMPLPVFRAMGKSFDGL
jgi:hypothetical protein